jgi:hypothetical protein
MDQAVRHRLREARDAGDEIGASGKAVGRVNDNSERLIRSLT